MKDLSKVYQGKYGEYKLSERDYLEAKIHRYSFFLILVCALISIALLSSPDPLANYATVLSGLYWLVCLSLAAILTVIHLYSIIIKFVLRLLLLIGVVLSLWVMISGDRHFTAALSEGTGYVGLCFILAVLTGLFFKEATCFEQLDAKALTIMPPLLVGVDVFTSLEAPVKLGLLWLWGGLFVSVMLRKAYQPLEYDIGDKSIIEDLEQWLASLKNNTNQS